MAIVICIAQRWKPQYNMNRRNALFNLKIQQ
ncbi:hypothetical protein T05_5290 [Trichinella murrelli]|uniref:Uncharacterized protein n=1 Tax=Trichinella murrelli TaxID=144512 RepID=A0A0V0SSZ5_9BILA|nr:hypothetical protein T05_5290 [Trichinella murrelli]